MALVAYLDWEVRTTGHDLNCSGFNPARDTANGVDYTQQDNAEITSLNWRVDATNNTWIRSAALENWSGTLASLKGNHIHLAGMAIGGTTLFSWVASTGKTGAYYLQASGGGNPNWPTKPTRVWLNQQFRLENTSLPAGANSWAWGDWDSLGYSTIYVRFGAESDANPANKNQDDVIADGKTWTRGAYEIVNVGTDGNGKYLVLDRSPAAVSSTDGYGRIGGAMASPGGVSSIAYRSQDYSSEIIWVRPGTYTVLYAVRDVPQGLPSDEKIFGYDGTRFSDPTNRPKIDFSALGTWGLGSLYNWWAFLVLSRETATVNVTDLWQGDRFWYCKVIGNGYSLSSIGQSATLICCHIESIGLSRLNQNFFYCYLKEVSGTGDRRPCGSSINSIFHGFRGRYVDIQTEDAGHYINTVFYDVTTANNGALSGFHRYLRGIIDSCVVVNANRYAFDVQPGQSRVNRGYYYNAAWGAAPSGTRWSNDITQLPGNPFRDPANGDFRLADNEAGRMLKQAGFAIPGPQGFQAVKFDAGAVQNSFYDSSGGGGGANLSRIFAGM